MHNQNEIDELAKVLKAATNIKVDFTGLKNMPLQLGANKYLVYGGPYYSKPPSAFGVKMAEEIYRHADVSIPTKDFSVPDVVQATEGLKATVKAILNHNNVYVGCMGGIGRTGLMLALIAKAFGLVDPIAYVRINYSSKAIETKEQEQYIRDFKIPLSLRLHISLYRLLSNFHLV